jgi:hypothetical protein
LHAERINTATKTFFKLGAEQQLEHFCDNTRI